ncbi:xanthine dehydrogenase molybdopterin binding subunit [Endozoicomonas sp. GU-1]|uniref:xanthine dehydrogenase molybdopterin binding subunit n=1 Tax=Endozoicomonas sp. GU-1 TaxID=3009078 RepID=UPI0022B4BD73|nr:xanthine dehydrogenase molybdopterin binding subunit [Endozoicomonas sp. GU-1]WBA82018.1 xanthine dehydrogenase molybdopterin binding subunit [Endozoicomonas sp. GU-1]WBA84964.1 xanthine dehydrogenase molybdopterin binding subunit [Endozoicomonas sp. GU-1]
MRKLPDLASEQQQSPKSGNRSAKHDSAYLHVTGKAIYIDDRPEMANQLHAGFGLSTEAHADIVSINVEEVWNTPGVIAVITADDIPGHKDIGPVFPGDMLLADGRVDYIGQPVFAVAATSHKAAKIAARKAVIEYRPLEAILGIDQAMVQNSFVRPDHTMKKGDAGQAIHNADHRLSGQMSNGGQEHFYLEGQIASVIPLEDGQLHVHTSSQHPSEVQKLVAEVIGIPLNKVVADVRRMGGGFGGKETQAAAPACIAALLAVKTSRPVKFRIDRQQDMLSTGKRHPFRHRYTVGFDQQGLLAGVDIELAGDAGHSPDLTDAIVDRAMFHSDNAYYLNNATVIGHRCRTNTASNTAFRGFGGPQGMLVIERIMDDIARSTGLDPLEVRKRNLYGITDRNTTHYHQRVEHNVLHEVIGQLEESSDYWQRREAIRAFNQQSPVLKKGLALTPVKFGISFTAKHLNQAGALVHVYTDGSIQINHGGTEMGQGLYIKVAQIVANEFGVALERVQVTSTRTDKVPNTSPTAASSGTDLNGKAAQDACQKIRDRLVDFAVEHYGVSGQEVSFQDDEVRLGERQMPFADFIQAAYLHRVSLSSSGFYSTPEIHYDRETASGRPFYYFACGASVSEVTVDTLTGEYKVDRVDILHDVGHSLNPAIDRGQIEGGFIQGMGWMTTEELVWDDSGRLLSNNPATYKIPTIEDMPPVFNVELFQQPNPKHTIYHSKAVGEPPFMLGMSVWCAIRDAVSSLSGYQVNPQIDVPATPERVLTAVTSIKKNAL